MGQPVVAGIPSSGPQPEGTERQGQIVDHHQHVLQGKFELPQPVADRIPAEIDEGGGLQQPVGAGTVLVLGYEAVPFVLKRNIGCPCKSIQYVKPDIVSCVCVIRSDISQACYQILHGKGVQE